MGLLADLIYESGLNEPNSPSWEEAAQRLLEHPIEPNGMALATLEMMFREELGLEVH